MSLVTIVILYLLANVADVITTEMVLKQGGQELNPVVKALMSIFGDLWFLPKIALAVGIFYLAYLYTNTWFLIVITLFFFVVSLWNLRVYYKLKG